MSEDGSPWNKDVERAERLAAHNKRLREASGEVSDDQPLVAFLYILARDHLPVGEIEGIMLDHVIVEEPNNEYTNGWLATWAKDVAARMMGQPPASAYVEEGEIISVHGKRLYIDGMPPAPIKLIACSDGVVRWCK